MIARLALLFTLVVAVAPHAGFAADAGSSATRSATQLDDDFFLQGEYSGSLAAPDSVAFQTGLQVIALGNGNFRAIEYAGGLPGSGWDGKTRHTYTGQKETPGVAELTGDGRRLSVRRGLVVVRDSSGKPRGELTKVLRLSQTLRAAPPAGARVLFRGRDAREFSKGVVTFDHFLVAGAETKQAFGDCTMHLEFRTPYMPGARGQGRGNSGVYIQGRYEVQVLDSFGLEGADNECGSLYKLRAPLVNMSFPPLSWQTYDIDFTAPRFDTAGKKSQNARITVRHNGVVVQNNVEITSKTGAGLPEGRDPRPIKLQDHGNPVHFRNIWIGEKTRGAESRECPATLLTDSKSTASASGRRQPPGGLQRAGSGTRESSGPGGD